MKKVLTLILTLVMLLSLLCACSEEGAEETKAPDVKPLRKEVVEAYETDEKLAKEVQALFDEFDKAFETLKNSAVDDAAFLAYAEAISDAVSNFEAFDPYYDKLIESDRYPEYADMQGEYADLGPVKFSLSSKLMGYKYSDEGSAEGCAETAFGVVNSYSEFFYGEYRLTDDDLDQLANS